MGRRGSAPGAGGTRWDRQKEMRLGPAGTLNDRLEAAGFDPAGQPPEARLAMAVLVQALRDLRGKALQDWAVGAACHFWCQAADVSWARFYSKALWCAAQPA